MVLLQNTRFRGAEETKNGEEFSKELADLADDFVIASYSVDEKTVHTVVEMLFLKASVPTRQSY